jgi:serine/threonine-protein kinase HipA
MARKGKVYYRDLEAGIITEDEQGYHFKYFIEYIDHPDARPVSLTLPLQEDEFSSKTMLPFFDGLIPEGWLLDVVLDTWKIDSRDRMALLLACCKDCIGAVSVLPMESFSNESY